MPEGLLSQFSTDGPVAQWAVLCAGILAVIYLIMRKPGRRKDPVSTNMPAVSLSQRRAAERDMNDLLVELSEMARRISAQLDNRSVKLELLIQQADERIQRLASMRETGTAPSASPGSPVDESAGEISDSSTLDPRHAEVYKLADEGQTSHQIAAALGRPNGEIELILALRAK